MCALWRCAPSQLQRVKRKLRKDNPTSQPVSTNPPPADLASRTTFPVLADVHHIPAAQSSQPTSRPSYASIVREDTPRQVSSSYIPPPVPSFDLTTQIESAFKKIEELISPFLALLKSPLFTLLKSALETLLPSLTTPNP